MKLTHLAPRNIPAESKDVDPIVRIESRSADAEIGRAEKIMDQPVPRIVEGSDSPRQTLSRLVDENFQFDESQLAALDGLSREKHAVLIGAAGTGKTTLEKALFDRIVDQLPHIDMRTYWKKPADNPEDEDDSYDMPESLIPGIVGCAFTGRAVQQSKRAFPRDWHSNFMTIHRLLGFVPEFYEDWDDLNDEGEPKNKMRFVPTYHEYNKLPWKVIVIDEAGMLGLPLWHQLLAACRDDTRIIMIGDINQLPPVHGKSVLGFAMAKWPTWELTHIHRQAGVNNSIVDNAWRVINGEHPISDDPRKPDWRFVTMEIDVDSNKASKQLRKWLETIHGKIYDPIRDTVITPINAFDETNGWQLGQDPLNRELALMFNRESGRYVIDAGRERKYFAVGDKVMATKNDHEAGITNGMTGVIKSIAPNGNYGGNKFRYGLIEEVNEYMAGHVEDDLDISLEDLASMVGKEKEKKEKESRDRGPSSHVVQVEFGHGESAFTMDFSTLSEVGSLMTAYVVTCHKMQGGEAPFVVVICHQSHKRMLYREWLYTAITRASERCVVLYTRMGLSTALGKQNIKGRTLAEKVESFNKLSDKTGLLGATINVNLPEPLTLEGSRDLTTIGFKGQQVRGEGDEDIQIVDAAEFFPQPPEPAPVKERIIERIIERETTVIVREKASVPEAKPEVVDMGEAVRAGPDELSRKEIQTLIKAEESKYTDTPYEALSKAIMLVAPPKLIPQMGAIIMKQRLEDSQNQLLLTHQPTSIAPVAEKPAAKMSIKELIAAQKAKKENM